MAEADLCLYFIWPEGASSRSYIEPSIYTFKVNQIDNVPL